MSYTRPSRRRAAWGCPPASKLTSLMRPGDYAYPDLNGEGSPDRQGEEGREGREAGRRPGRARLRDEGRQPDSRRRGAPGGRLEAPDGGGGADLRRARPDEGRGDEGRPGGVVHRHGRVPARVPGAHPGEACRAARRGAARV